MTSGGLESGQILSVWLLTALRMGWATIVGYQSRIGGVIGESEVYDWPGSGMCNRVYLDRGKGRLPERMGRFYWVFQRVSG